MGKAGLAALIAAVFISSPAVLAQDNELNWNMESAITQLIERASGGGTLTVDFAVMARNLNLKDDLFDDDWPKGTQKVKQ